MLLAGLFLLATLTQSVFAPLQRAGITLTQARVLDLWERALSWLWRAAPAYPLVVALAIALLSTERGQQWRVRHAGVAQVGLIAAVLLAMLTLFGWSSSVLLGWADCQQRGCSSFLADSLRYWVRPT